jgi:osmotically-inducible protein OsmY
LANGFIDRTNLVWKLMIVMAASVARHRFGSIGKNDPPSQFAEFRANQENNMKSDSEIERDVRDELKWDPDLNADDIAVSVKNGVVTLAGFTHSYTDRLEAEIAAKRVAGVLAVANDIEVRLPAIDQRPDPDIARDAVAALKSQLPISYDQIKIIVKGGWITLEGAVEWQYQKTTADMAVRKVKGVKGVTNVITVKPKVQPTDIQHKIKDAFKRSAEVDAERITVEAKGSEVVLEGTVRSWIEREEAERVAWSAPGVTKVEDRIVVRPY